MNKQKKHLFKVLIIGFLLVFISSYASAAYNPAGGLVPCGSPGQPPCTPCHLWQLADNIVDFLLKWMALPILTVALVAGGIMWLIFAGDPGKITKGRNIITSSLIGILIAFGGWLIVDTIINTLGQGELRWSWQQIEACPEPATSQSSQNNASGQSSISTGQHVLNAEEILEQYPNLDAAAQQELRSFIEKTPPELRRYIFVDSATQQSMLNIDQMMQDRENADKYAIYRDGIVVNENPYFEGQMKATGEGEALRQGGMAGNQTAPPAYNRQIDDRYGALIREKSLQNGIDPDYVRATIQVESSGNPDAASNDQDGGHSYGLMQVRTETARTLDPAVRNLSDAQIAEKLKNPEYNIDIGTKYQKQLLDKYKSPELASAAYNGGPLANAPSRDCAGQRRYQCEWDNTQHTKPNVGYKITRNYVQKVNSLTQDLKKN